MVRSPRLLPLFGSLAAFVLGSCESGLSITTTLTPEGMTLELPGGASLVIPEGALSEDVEVTATVVTDLAAAGHTALAEGFEAPAFAISLEPHGLQFAQAATLTLPGGNDLTLPGGNDVAYPVVMHAAFDRAAEWDAVGPVTVGEGVVTVPIGGFSTYALTLVRDGACPCFDAADIKHYYDVGRAAGVGEWNGYGVSHMFRGDTGALADGQAYVSTERPGSQGYRICSVGVSSNRPVPPSGPEGPADPVATDFDTYFPNRDPTVSYGSGARFDFPGNSDAQLTACGALIRAGIGGNAARTLTIEVHGLSAEGSLAVEDSVGGGSTLLRSGENPVVVGDGAPYSITITEAPEGFECAFSNGTPSPFAGTATTDTHADILCVAEHTAAAPWSYEGETGPEYWGELREDWATCSEGQAQSPIDIVTASVAPTFHAFPVIEWGTTQLRAFNPGYYLRYEVDPGSTLSWNAATYDLRQFHFHALSEHTIDGDHSDMEIHFVHEKQGNPSQLAVVGFFVDGSAMRQVGSPFGAEGPLHFHDAIALEESHTATALGASVDLGQAFGTDSFLDWTPLFYTGSLTTPPCAEGVDFLLHPGVFEIDEVDMAAFHTLFDNNFRPVQPLNGRAVSGIQPLGR